MKRKIAIVGSRNFSDLDLVRDFIRQLNHRTIIISGGARGVDQTAAETATARGMEVNIILPDWSRFGKSAGMLRNTTIVELADIIVAFWDGRSRGTADTIRKARKMNKPIKIIQRDI